ncbi:MAG: ADP-ribosylglycohydrolase family protein [Actinomycetes bacterium]
MTRPTEHRVQHALGAMVGSAVGDALGAPFEFQPGGLWSAKFPQAVVGERGEMRAGGMWAAGEFTDDTQMALALAESLCEHRQLDPADVWARWIEWSQDAADVGILTQRALRYDHWEGAAAHAHEENGGKSAGNGGIMRNTPIALFTLDQTSEAACALAEAQSNLTHLDADCAIGARLHTLALRAGINGDNVFEALDDAVRRIDGAESRARWAELLSPDWHPDQTTLTNGTVWTCLAQAVWAVRYASSFEAAVTRAVDLGDDADTVACVAGSIAGAIWGIQAIPSRWTTYLCGTVGTNDGVQAYRSSTLQDLTLRLLGRSPSKIAYADTPEGPTAVDDSGRLFAADWGGARSAPTDWAVVSACRTGDDFLEHPIRREIYLIDEYDEAANHNVAAAVLDAVDSIDALLADHPEQKVLVHCHGGRSRTALILKAWAMRRYSWTEPQAHDWLRERWPRAHRENPVFTRFLTEEWLSP